MIPWVGVNVVAKEIEKGSALGKTDTRGVRLVAFGEAVQKYEEKFWVDLIDGSITEIQFFGAEPNGIRRLSRNL